MTDRALPHWQFLKLTVQDDLRGCSHVVSLPFFLFVKKHRMEPGSPTLDNNHFPNLTVVHVSKIGENMQPFPPSSPNYKKLKTENYTGIHFTALMIVLVITNKIIYIVGKTLRDASRLKVLYKRR